ncbi:MAG: hypothetical protein H0U35_06485 [Sporichthyaceae bacterium]|nr:hypothetical protein [Sporichthyaceae bacterium]
MGQQLRTSLQQIAKEATVVDLRPRVLARARLVRRRRRMASVAAVVSAVLAVGAVLSSPTEPEAAPPAGRAVPTVNLGDARSGGLPDAELSVVDVDSGDTWLVTTTGRAAQLPVRVDSLSGALPMLFADGTVLAFGGPGQATLVRTGDGSVTKVSVPTDQEYLPVVSPDARTLTYAEDNQVDAIELTLVPLDDTPPTTLRVTTSGASSTLVPIAWSDDGTGLLVLEGRGATRVDLEPRPRARQGVHVKQDVVLANGWAVAPDLSRFVMGNPAPSGGRRTWLVLDADDGSAIEELTRPAGDRLIGWTAGDRLVWWHPANGSYSVLTTDTAGRSLSTKLRLTSTLHNLRATWTQDEG